LQGHHRVHADHVWHTEFSGERGTTRRGASASNADDLDPRQFAAAEVFEDKASNGAAAKNDYSHEFAVGAINAILALSSSRLRQKGKGHSTIYDLRGAEQRSWEKARSRSAR